MAKIINEPSSVVGEMLASAALTNPRSSSSTATTSSCAQRRQGEGGDHLGRRVGPRAVARRLGGRRDAVGGGVRQRLRLAVHRVGARGHHALREGSRALPPDRQELHGRSPQLWARGGAEPRRRASPSSCSWSATTAPSRTAAPASPAAAASLARALSTKSLARRREAGLPLAAVVAEAAAAAEAVGSMGVALTSCTLPAKRRTSASARPRWRWGWASTASLGR